MINSLHTTLLMKKACIIISLIFLSIHSFVFAAEAATEETSVQSVLKEAKGLYTELQLIKNSRDDVVVMFEWVENTYFEITNHELLTVLHDSSKQINDIIQDIRQLSLTQDMLKESNQRVVTLRKETQQTHDEIIHLTRLLYQMDNEFNDDSIFEDIKLWVKAENSMLATSQQWYVELLIDTLDELTTTLIKQEQEEVSILKQTFAQKEKLKQTIIGHHKQLDSIAGKIEEVEKFINLYEDNKIQFDREMQELFIGREEIEEEIGDIHQLIHQGDFYPEWDYESAKERLFMLIERGSDQSYPLSWPLLPIESIDMYFDDDRYYQQHNAIHQWITLSSSIGNALYASNDWVVIKATSNPGWWINWMLIEHEDTRLTAYIDIYESVVNVGDVVRRGQVIWFAWGNTSSTSTAFVKESAQFTFLVREVSWYVDPLTLLDLSVISNITSIPAVLAWKQQIDFQKRPIDLTSITFMEGETLEERQQSFLDIYARGVYRNRDLWEVAWVNHEIDTTFSICIGFAESTLGNHLSTDNNIGNVGNFDDPSIRTKLSHPLAWVQVIYDTLDNYLLGDYNRIDELSGYGNRNNGLPIYASSQFNRQNNVLKCLSMIHGYYVPEDYSFRTWLRTQVTNSFQVWGELGTRE